MSSSGRYRSKSYTTVGVANDDTPKMCIRDRLRITAKLRYNQKPASATLWPEDGGAAVVEFDAPQRAVSPGQAAVFYADDYLLGGGTICGAEPPQMAGDAGRP